MSDDRQQLGALPQRIEDCYSRDTALFLMARQIGKVVDFDAGIASELEDAAYQDWLALGPNRDARRLACIRGAKDVIKMVEARDKGSDGAL